MCDTKIQAQLERALEGLGRLLAERAPPPTPPIIIIIIIIINYYHYMKIQAQLERAREDLARLLAERAADAHNLPLFLRLKQGQAIIVL